MPTPFTTRSPKFSGRAELAATASPIMLLPQVRNKSGPSGPFTFTYTCPFFTPSIIAGWESSFRIDDSGWDSYTISLRQLLSRAMVISTSDRGDPIPFRDLLFPERHPISGRWLKPTAVFVVSVDHLDGIDA